MPLWCRIHSEKQGCPRVGKIVYETVIACFIFFLPKFQCAFPCFACPPLFSLFSCISSLALDPLQIRSFSSSMGAGRSGCLLWLLALPELHPNTDKKSLCVCSVWAAYIWVLCSVCLLCSWRWTGTPERRLPRVTGETVFINLTSKLSWAEPLGFGNCVQLRECIISINYAFDE